MSDNLKPDLHIDAKGWTSLPPESQAALYPLLQKERHTGRDIARITMFNAIAAFNDERVLNEDTIRSMAASMTDAGWKIYNKYMAAFFVLKNATEVVSKMTASVRISCQLLTLYIENALCENIYCHNCNRRRYDIEEIANFKKGREVNKSVYTHNEWNDSWKEVNEIITKCAIIRFMFKAAGMALNVPGLEAMLNLLINGLRLITQAYAKITIDARKQFLTLDIPEKAKWIPITWTQPLLDIDSITVPDKIMQQAKRALRLDSFAYDYSMLDDIFEKYLSQEIK